MLCEPREPGLGEVLSDPIIQAVMKADGVNPVSLEAELRRIARHLGGDDAPPRAPFDR
jgi:hypothetical protein